MSPQLIRYAACQTYPTSWPTCVLRDSADIVHNFSVLYVIDSQNCDPIQNRWVSGVVSCALRVFIYTYIYIVNGLVAAAVQTTINYNTWCLIFMTKSQVLLSRQCYRFLMCGGYKTVCCCNTEGWRRTCMT